MAVVDGGTLVGRVLREQNVKHLFAINGGHTFPILANLRNNDIKLIHMRHEQACAYAADAYARTTAGVGVCSVTAGCGLTNAVTGLCVAGLTNSAVVCIAGQHPTTEDYLGSFQEAYGSDVCRSFSKYVKRVLDWSTIEFDLRLAFREALSPPQGVGLIEIPTNILYHGDDESKQRKGAKVYEPDAVRSQGDPAQIERALELLVRAERPLIACGDGIFWSQAGAELRELVDLTHIPAYARRAGQGAIAEDHPLAIRGSWKKPFTGRADVVLAIGFRFWSGEHFGEPPTWNDKATYIQADPVPSRIGWQVPAEVAIVGDPKLVLRQLIDTAKRLKLDFSRQRQSAWVKEVAEVRANYENLIDESEQKVRDRTPIHPDRLARDLCAVMDKDATVVIDSFTLSGWMTQWFRARFPGQVVDAGPLAPVGHGVGMAIGVQLARPGKQVVLVTGDGGLGIGGWDIETALRYDLPVQTVLWNNSSWGPSFEQMPLLKGRTDPFNMIENIRYDQMFKIMGCHGEHAEKPDEIVPALERAFKSGKASLINVVGDKRVGHPRLGGNLLGSTQV
ncbi:MAG: thiamine pyrophosphate-binding protein [Deltaproteobacteria bacterium]|nr:thiamine pyrophosphate-binding protein [Deltaproteobacteria bacterium]MBI3387283.1 thiamine pyrophosphate-binding protein [Deltaproteobacteria bacterium]